MKKNRQIFEIEKFEKKKAIARRDFFFKKFQK
jgi:hypothetical protein